MCYKAPHQRFLKKMSDALFFYDSSFNLYYSEGEYKMFVDDRANFWRWIGAA